MVTRNKDKKMSFSNEHNKTSYDSGATSRSRHGSRREGKS